MRESGERESHLVERLAGISITVVSDDINQSAQPFVSKLLRSGELLLRFGEFLLRFGEFLLRFGESFLRLGKFFESFVGESLRFG